MSAQVYDAIVIGAGQRRAADGAVPGRGRREDAGRRPVRRARARAATRRPSAASAPRTPSPAKIRLCLESLRIFSTWKEAHGDDIEWFQGGYVFVAYREQEERSLKELLKVQQQLRPQHRLARARRDARARPRPQPRGAARRHLLARGRVGVADAVVRRVLPAGGRAGRAVPVRRARHRRSSGGDGRRRRRAHRQGRLRHRDGGQRGRRLGAVARAVGRPRHARGAGQPRGGHHRAGGAVLRPDARGHPADRRARATTTSTSTSRAASSSASRPTRRSSAPTAARRRPTCR